MCEGHCGCCLSEAHLGCCIGVVHSGCGGHFIVGAVWVKLFDDVVCVMSLTGVVLNAVD